ncbi:MAG: DNA translocase FtsK 4TM domain-containing protein [Methylacidiphilales bacterium]|nr:DNA translocase FtsK 4TM domain-containing protein [Candidatus Methylacidiphilales bacterium]
MQNNNFEEQTIRTVINEIVAIGILGMVIVLAISLFSFSPCDSNWLTTTGERSVSNVFGKIGASLSHALYFSFGFFAWGWVILFGLIGVGKLRGGLQKEYLSRVEQKYDLTFAKSLWFQLATGAITIFCLSALAAMHVKTMPDYLPNESGGVVGLFVAKVSIAMFNELGATALLYFLAITSAMLYSAMSFSKLTYFVGHHLIRLYTILLQRYQKQTIPNDYPETQTFREPFTYVEPEPAPIPNTEQSHPQSINQPATPQAQSIPIQKTLVLEKSFMATDQEKPKFLVPPITLIHGGDNIKVQQNQVMLEKFSRLVEMKLKEFGVEATVVALKSGPVITLFELDLGAGIKASKITGLERDLARSLSVSSIRVLEVIPGKSVIGLEVPNPTRQSVYLSELLASECYQNSNALLPLALGKDISGNPVVSDLAEMPHLLVAGTTGSGKSVGINGMLLSMLFKRSSSELRLILVDPKRIELGMYDGIPHLLTPVITDTGQVLSALRWCVMEMESRYKKMELYKVKSIKSYNSKLKESPLENSSDEEPLPYIVLVIDEFADMMHQVGKKAESYIVSLAQKARACGIHLILATQRPTVDVITGLIKSNIPSRIAFQVSSKLDSRTILEQGGAEQLLGKGDMLFMRSANLIPERIHGPYVSENDVEAVVGYLRELTGGAMSYEVVLPSTEEGGDQQPSGSTENFGEAHYQEALEIVKTTKRVSVSYLQRRLRLGYNHAARLIDIMEKQGLVTPLSSNGKREYIGPE